MKEQTATSKDQEIVATESNMAVKVRTHLPTNISLVRPKRKFHRSLAYVQSTNSKGKAIKSSNSPFRTRTNSTGGEESEAGRRVPISELLDSVNKGDTEDSNGMLTSWHRMIRKRGLGFI